MSNDTAISRTFADVASQQRLAFMPFITAGDPDMAMTVTVIEKLAKGGGDLIEVGFPYSDPIADGPVIQASYTRALEGRVSVNGILEAISTIDRDRTPPLVAMVSYAIIFRHGLERFVAEAKEAGFAGFIVPDLPGDEAAECFELVRSHGLDLVQLVAPTTPRERAREILKCCSGFVYCVAVAGTTGERTDIAEALLQQLRWLRDETDLPLAVGFGISRPEHVAPLRGLADGVIVGSALVKHLERLSEPSADRAAVLAEIGGLATQLVAATGSG